MIDIIVIVDKIGYYGPIILSANCIGQLWMNSVYWQVYLVMFIANYYINGILKLWIKQDRPTGGISISGESHTGADQYGMPSAHAQFAAFSTVYLYLVKHSQMWLIISVFISSLTVYQRWKYRRHTVEQLGAGVAVGVMIAWASYMGAKMIIDKTSVEPKYDQPDKLLPSELRFGELQRYISK